MPFPNTETELKKAGYSFLRADLCSGADCGQWIEWWETPKKKRIPLNKTDKRPHWTTCPNADQFRKGKPRSGQGG